MLQFSDQIVDGSGYRRPVQGALVYLLNANGTVATAFTPNPQITDDFGAFSFAAPDGNDGVYNFEARIGGVTIARGPKIIGAAPEFKGDPGAPGVNPESIGTFSAGMRPNIDNGTTRVRTAGPSRGDFVYDSTLTETDRAAYPLAMFRDTAGRVFRRDPRDLWVEQFGAQSSLPGLFDSAPAIRAALAYAALCGQGDPLGYPSLRGTPRIRIGVGRFYLASRILIAATVQIIGEGSGVEGGEAGTIFECGESGFSFDRYNTTNGAVVTPTHAGADGSLIQGVLIRSTQTGAAKAANGNFGIRANCRIKVIDTLVIGFPGQGIYIYGTSNPGSPTDFAEGEANGCLFRNITVTACYTGVQIGAPGAEADVNVANFEGVCTLSGNYKWGLDAQNFLSCTFANLHFKENGQLVHYAGKWYQGAPGQESAYGTTQPGTNALVWSYVKDGPSGFSAIPTWTNGGSYRGGGPVKHINASGRSVFTSCYYEEGQPKPWINFPAISVGGQWEHAAGATGVHITGEQGELRSRALRASVPNISTSTGLSSDTGLEVSNGTKAAYFGARGTGFRVGIGQGDADTALYMRGVNTSGLVDIGFIEARKMIVAGPFADNAAAVAAGLVPGSLYRVSGDPVPKVVV